MVLLLFENQRFTGAPFLHSAGLSTELSAARCPRTQQPLGFENQSGALTTVGGWIFDRHIHDRSEIRSVLREFVRYECYTICGELCYQDQADRVGVGSFTARALLNDRDYDRFPPRITDFLGVPSLRKYNFKFLNQFHALYLSGPGGMPLKIDIDVMISKGFDFLVDLRQKIDLLKRAPGSVNIGMEWTDIEGQLICA